MENPTLRHMTKCSSVFDNTDDQLIVNVKNQLLNNADCCYFGLMVSPDYPMASPICLRLVQS